VHTTTITTPTITTTQQNGHKHRNIPASVKTNIAIINNVNNSNNSSSNNAIDTPNNNNINKLNIQHTSDNTNGNANDININTTIISTRRRNNGSINDSITQYEQQRK